MEDGATVNGEVTVTAADVTFRADLRSGGWAGLTDDALLIATDDRRLRIPIDDVAQVTLEDYDYFLGVLSVVLVGFGLWFARSNPLALLFSVAGLASGYRVYTHRGTVTVHVRNRPKPIRFHPVDAAAFVRALRDAGVVERRPPGA